MLSEFEKEVKFISILLEEMTKVQKPSVTYNCNQGEIFLAKNRQVGMRTNHIYICRHFLRNMVEDKDTDIKYIQSEENAVDIMMKNTSEADFCEKHENNHRWGSLGARGNWKGECQEYQSHL